MIHGSSTKYKIGDMLVAKPWKTEFSSRRSIDGVNIEKFVDSFRPKDENSRLKSIFMVRDVSCLNKAGASDDYVYEVKPVGSVTKCHWSWFNAVLGLQGDDEPFKNNAKAAKYAENYWAGVRCHKFNCDGRGVWEYLAKAVVIVEDLKDFDASEYGLTKEEAEEALRDAGLL